VNTPGVEVFEESKFVEETMEEGGDETPMESVHEAEGSSHFASMNETNSGFNRIL